MKPASNPLRLLFICNLVALALLALTQGGCGPTARDKALSTTFAAVNATRDQFLAWEKQHLLAIVDEAKTEAEADTRAADYFKRRQVVLEALEAAYRVLAFAALDGKADLATVLRTAVELGEALKALQSSDSVSSPSRSSP